MDTSLVKAKVGEGKNGWNWAKVGKGGHLQ